MSLVASENVRQGDAQASTFQKVAVAKQRDEGSSKQKRGISPIRAPAKSSSSSSTGGRNKDRGFRHNEPRRGDGKRRPRDGEASRHAKRQATPTRESAVNVPDDDDARLNGARDPRGGTKVGGFRQVGNSGKKGRNTESFEPASTFVRPAMRVRVGPKKDVFDKPLKHDDVVVVPDFFCEEDDWDIYYRLIEEMTGVQRQGERGSEWIPWHEGCHLVTKNPEGCDTFKEIIRRVAQYFDIELKSVGTRFNWYRDSSDWKPFHHDSAAFNPHRARNQNITVGMSFGAERELAFLHATNGSRAYFPQTNGMMFSFGRDVNINFKHGINALPPAEHNGKGRISIVLWGLAPHAIEEDNSPPILTNDSRRGFDNRKGRGGGGPGGGGRGGGGRDSHRRRNDHDDRRGGGRRNDDHDDRRGGRDHRDRDRDRDGGRDRDGRRNERPRDGRDRY